MTLLRYSASVLLLHVIPGSIARFNGVDHLTSYIAVKATRALTTITVCIRKAHPVNVCMYSTYVIIPRTEYVTQPKLIMGVVLNSNYLFN